ncbi:MAG: arsenate reductase (azurin) large subunit [Elusimicrobiota bacterium]
MSLEKTVTPPPDYVPAERVPLPPPDARVRTTVCDYCVVGCGYRTYVWPEGREGGPRAKDNAFGVDFPVAPLSGYWVTPNQHTIVLVGGEPHHAIVIPDPKAKVVNRGGNHSVRGGAIAQKCYSPRKPTRDRLKHPLLRVDGKLVPVSWDAAIRVMAEVSKHVLAKHGEISWGMKTFSYQSFESMYAISKLCFESIKTPAFSTHDAPTVGDESAGLTDSGYQTFGASYDDLAQAEVLFISGVDPYETKTVLFTEWLRPPAHRTGRKGPKMIIAAPRRTMGVAYAEKDGGLWLDVNPGTDTLLHLAVIRYIFDQGWEDAEFLKEHTASDWEIQSGFGRGTRNTPWQWRTTWSKYGTDYLGYRKWILNYRPAGLAQAARVTGISEEKIIRAAKMLTGGGGRRPKSSFVYEKGNYWTNNYTNTTSYAALAIVNGAGHRAGRVVCRLGGHQRGWAAKAAPYPLVMSPERLAGRRKKPLDLDRWVESGRLRFAWVIGATWIQAMAASDELKRKFLELTRGSEHQIRAADPEHAAAALIKRVDAGGMFVVDQDVYLREPIGSDIADLVLPAAGWGESDFARANGERRLRLYSKFYDPPGEALPDWEIIARFGRAMGFEDYKWSSSNDLFEEAARFSRDDMLNYYPLVWYAKEIGKPAHEVLREMGTTGIQLPARYRSHATEGRAYIEYAGSYSSPKHPGIVVGTKRLHDPETDFGTPEGPTTHPKWLRVFQTHSGKVLLHKSPWETFSDFYAAVRPQQDELWVTSGRINEKWQSGYDDQRRPYSLMRWPDSFIELHPRDAAARGIESGDYIEASSDDVLVQTGGFVGRRPDDLTFSALEREGHIRRGRGSFRAVAIVTDDIKPGVAFSYSDWPTQPANALSPRVPDPITNHYRFKLGKGRIRRIGESPYKKSLRSMTFLPRTII